MANTYDAMRRAEQERRGADASGDSAVKAVDWDRSSDSAATAKKTGWFGRKFRGAAPKPQAQAVLMNKRRISMLQPRSYAAEQFRTLRGRIDALATQRPIKTVTVTSAVAGEGKSTAALNLAVVTAMSMDRRVLLVECDMRRPVLADVLGIEPRAGLGEVLLEKATVSDAIVKVGDFDLDVLPVRARPDNPSELLSSSRMAKLIEEVAGSYDRIIFDTPVVLGLSDAKSVSDLCDGVVMVVRAGQTPLEEVEAALDVIDRRRLLGVVLNGAEMSEEETYGQGSS